MNSVGSYGGSGLRGVVSGCKLGCARGVGIGRKREQLLSFRNMPSFSEASSDWRMIGSLHGRGRNLRLSFAY